MHRWRAHHLSTQVEILKGRLVGAFLIGECNQYHGLDVEVAMLERLLVVRRDASVTKALGQALGFAQP
jgi:hypothetical protein